MTDAPLRKFVKPAHAGACIPDLAHGNDLPQAGTEVVWDAYWIGREMRGEIVVVDQTSPVADEAKPSDAPPA